MAGVVQQTFASLSKRLWSIDTPVNAINAFVAIDAAGLSRLTAAGRFGTAWTGSSGTTVGDCVAGGRAGFMAMRASTTQGFYSADGINWTQRTTPNVNWNKIATNGTRFVAVGNSTNLAYYSDDKGVTWNSATLPLSANWTGITCNKATGVWIAVATGQNKIARSTDGSTWTSVNAPSASSWFAVTSTDTVGGRFVAIAQSSTAAMYSTDGGLTWTGSTMSSSLLNWNIAYGNGLFVTASRTLSPNNYMTSPDGITWTTRSCPLRSIGIAFGNGRFMVCALNTNSCYYSLDGISWTVGTNYPTDGFGSLGQWIDICFA